MDDIYRYVIDGIEFEVKEEFDFSFIKKYGTVFKVFDKQSSGCLCFGVIKENKKYFLKFAGVKTLKDYFQNPQDAVDRLKASVKKYLDIKSPSLIKMISSEEVGEGFIIVFEWFDGESCGSPQPETKKRFLQLPKEEKLRIYKGILSFIADVKKCGYTAIDFNDQSTLYNFETKKFAICDIDFYNHGAYMNGLKGMCGDSFLMSPEESRPFAIIDEISNVYNMGSYAFMLFGKGEKWELNKKSFLVALKATNDNRNLRYQTIDEYIIDWNKALEIK